MDDYVEIEVNSEFPCWVEYTDPDGSGGFGMVAEDAGDRERFEELIRLYIEKHGE